jgi:beta-lactam-binding protein with PASTA domain
VSAGTPPPDGPPPPPDGPPPPPDRPQLPPEDAPTVYEPYPEPVEEIPPTELLPPAAPVDMPPGPPLDPMGLPPEEPEPSRELWPWLLLLLVLVIGGLLAAYLLTRNNDDNNANTGTNATTGAPVQTTPGTVPTKNTVKVPAVVGLKQAEAESQLKALGFATQARKQSSAKPGGTVVAQSPAAGARIKRGSVVGLTVSSGAPAKKGVPDVVGKTAAEASSQLTDAGLKVTTKEVNSTKQAGTVISQSPTAGTDVAKGSTVALTVSKGPADVSVPDVVGLKRADAEKKLRQAGLEPNAHGVASQKKAGTVVAQHPAAGDSAPQGSQVRINVSNGPSGATTPTPTATTPTTPTTTTPPTTTAPTGKVDVPDVTGEDEQQATSDLEDAGFVVQSTDRPVDDETQDGVVQSQRPAGGGQASSGSTVTIVVGRFSG